MFILGLPYLKGSTGMLNVLKLSGGTEYKPDMGAETQQYFSETKILLPSLPEIAQACRRQRTVYKLLSSSKGRS